MQDEATISINGTRLSDRQSMIVRVALDALADILANQLEGRTPGTDVYQNEAASVIALIADTAPRTQ
jgi:hypothetical protein